jgi:hypothetical protein
LETPPKHKPHKPATGGSSSSSSTAAAADSSSSSTSGSGSDSGSAASGSASASDATGSASASDATGSGSASAATGSASASAATGSDGKGGSDVNSFNSGVKEVGGAPRKSSLIMVGVAAVCGVALAAAFVPKRKVEVSDHPLKGSLNKRIKIFTHMAQHAKDPTARPPRRFEEEGTSYINANEAMV